VLLLAGRDRIPFEALFHSENGIITFESKSLRAAIPFLDERYNIYGTFRR